MNSEIWNLTKVKKQRKNPFPFLKNLRIVDNDHFKDYLDYCKSPYFKRLKKEVLKRYNGFCQYCGNKANTAHHLHYRSKWTATELEDCIAVCNKCHSEIHDVN